MDCSGCGACTLVCPTGCMTITKNEKGFLNVSKDSSRCIHCNLCHKVCPLEQYNYPSLDEAAYSHNDEIRRTTSSGGLGFCIARRAIQNGYSVCGVVYDYKNHCAKHRIFHSMEELELLKGSKYLQSNNAEAFAEIITALKTDENIRFIVFGTPCQIAGLNRVLEHYKFRNRVILIDIFCHGVPSDLLWKKYLAWLNKKRHIESDKINSILFRDKAYSWHTYYIHISSMDREYVNKKEKDPFLKLFTMGVVNQECCFTCKYRNHSAADLRLGDYWGEKYKNTEDGVSMLLIGTDSGKGFVEKLEDVWIDEQPISDRMSQQHSDFKIPQFYTKSFEMLKDEKTRIKAVVNLYETSLDRALFKIKRCIKKFLRRI